MLVLNNAVNTEEFISTDKVRNKTKEELGLQNKLVIGHVGRFNKQKNHNFLIDIFKSVHDKNKNAVLVLVGDGDLRKLIEKK